MPRENVHRPCGRVRAYTVSDMVQAFARKQGCDFGLYRGETPIGWTRLTNWTKNTILYEWATIVGKLLLRQGTNYGISGMYLEFENVADSDDIVSPPSVGRDADEGIEYYNGLATSDDRDYIRVPLIAGVLNIEDETKFPGGNIPTFFAQTSGTVGVHGKAFSDVVNSKVFGGALVAFVDDADSTQDLVLARYYLPTSKQMSKLPTSQCGLEWEITLK